MATITVTTTANSGVGSLRNAINTAKDGDKIRFSPSLINKTITLDKGISFGKSLTIDGKDAPNLTLSGGKKSNILWLGVENKNLTVKNLTFADSYFDKVAGGAIWAKDNSTVRVENSIFKNNVSDGAALHAQQGSNVTVVNSKFDGNDGAKISDKSYSAGAISLFAYGKLTVKGSTFTNNKSLSGGAVRVTGSDVIIEDSVFLNNDSTPGADKGFVDVPGGGGALYLDGASIPADPRFYQGPLKRETEGGTVKIKNSKFEGNRGAGEGGAIMFYGYNQDKIIIEDSEIVNNQVIKNKQGKANGGGLWLMGFIDIRNTKITNNKSTDDGGGLWYWGEVPANIKNTTISGNTAKNNGGGIYNRLWGSQTNLTDVTLKDNAAGKEAGAIYIKNGDKITAIAAKNSVFENNKAGDKQQVSRELIDKGNNYQSPNSGDPVTENVNFGVPKSNSATSPKPQSVVLSNDLSNYQLENELNSGENQDSQKVEIKDSGKIGTKLNESTNDSVANNDTDVIPEVRNNQNPAKSSNLLSSPETPSETNKSKNLQINNSVSSDSQDLTVDFGVNPGFELLDLRNAENDSLIQAEFIVNRAAAYDNTFGFYKIDDENGRIANLSPGDSGYAQAAIKQRLDLSEGLPGGELIAPFLISDGTPEEFLEQNPNNFSQDTKVAYFAFTGANPDRKDHIKLLDNNKIGFEDLYGLGDRSFDDLTVKVKFSPA